MPAQLFLLPDGTWARFSTVVMGFTHSKMSEEEMIKDLGEDIRPVMESLKKGENPYEGWGMTLEEAIQMQDD